VYFPPVTVLVSLVTGPRPGRPRHGHCFLINPSLSLSLRLRVSLSLSGPGPDSESDETSTCVCRVFIFQVKDTGVRPHLSVGLISVPRCAKRPGAAYPDPPPVIPGPLRLPESRRLAAAHWQGPPFWTLEFSLSSRSRSKVRTRTNKLLLLLLLPPGRPRHGHCFLINLSLSLSLSPSDRPSSCHRDHFGLWSFRFPLVLVRTGRRLPVQALCERRVVVALTGYPRGGAPGPG